MSADQDRRPNAAGRPGIPVDADADGEPGDVALIDFDTVSMTRISDSSVFGYVFASEEGPDGEDLPLEGVTITVKGLEEGRDITDAEGRFQLDDVPVP